MEPFQSAMWLLLSYERRVVGSRLTNKETEAQVFVLGDTVCGRGRA